MKSEAAGDREGKRPRGVPLLSNDFAYAIVQALQQSDYDVTDANTFVGHIRNIDYGLSAEVEFAAIAAWLGRIRLIHQVSGKRTVSHGLSRDIVAPDLMAFVEFAGERRSVLLEVKTTKGLRLRARRGYLDALQRYADAVSLPLLIAWRPRLTGWWMVFDPLQAPWDAERQVFEFSDVAPHDIMSAVFGDYWIDLYPGTGFSIRAEFISEKQHTDEAYDVNVRIADAWFHAPDGKRIEQPVAGVFTAVLANSEYKLAQTEKDITQSWVAAQRPLHAQTVLRMSVGFALEKGERIRWHSVAARLDRILSRDRLLADLQTTFGSITKYVIHQVPTKWPDFVPAAWKNTKP